MTLHAKIQDLLAKLIEEGEAVLSTEYRKRRTAKHVVYLRPYSKWRARCRLLAKLLGTVGKPWEADLTANWDHDLDSAKKTQGVLEAIQASANNGLLVQIEELLWANAFADLSEQAEYLFEQGFFLASAVIHRAVLEQRLRLLCQQNSISLKKGRPTLNDYNMELFKAKIYDKIMLKEIDTLIAIGNEAAHNDSGFNADKAKRLKNRLKSILLKLSS
jgi:hypothetical protein